ncbi:MAG TPA: histidine phosphatase family protein [Candidatus Methanofastidiosa archaeon]|nr:histidine phosphatase family protein [Candidatus Methanofastidiosa archaeon]HPR42678.1 histidine phosphatase family protein [Candidatus Methanofastidiosa archaeon]
MASIHLLRHARTEANAERRFCGWSESEPLAGELEDLRLLSPPSVDMVFCSPSNRCIKTAEALGYDDQSISDSIREVNFGSWEMRTFDELEKERPEETEQYLGSPLNFRFPDGESLRDVGERTNRFLVEELGPCLDEDMDALIVGHLGSLKLLLINMLGLDLSIFWKLSVKPARFSSVSYCNDGDERAFRLETLNSTGCDTYGKQAL